MHTRRSWLSLAAGGLLTPPALRSANVSANDGPGVLCVGAGGRGTGVALAAAAYGRMVGCCDVNSVHNDRMAKILADAGRPKAALYRDYRKALEERKDADVVVIGTPDHWHARVLIDALRAGKDVYCEKPMTLTIAEGQAICKAVRETGRVVQVGTQQRTEFNRNFLAAIAIVRSGVLGKRVTAICSIGEGPVAGPFPITTPPATLDWDLWQGPAFEAPYSRQRADFNFRYFLDYSGGHITDWGAHHLDIAQWALEAGNKGIVDIEATGNLPAGREATLAHVLNRQRDTSNVFNAAATFRVVYRYANGSTIILQSEEENGIEFIGENSRFFVSRDRMAGPALKLTTQGPDPMRARIEEDIHRIYGGIPSTHMKNFMDRVRDRKLPISDVFSHHRSVTACHLANIALLLGRKLRWDAEREDFVGDAEASALRTRPQRFPAL